MHGRGVVDLAQQLQQHHLLLERLEDRPDGLGEVEDVAREVGRTRQRDALLRLVDERLEDHRHDAREHRADRRRRGVGQVGQRGRRVDQARAVQAAAEDLAEHGDVVVGQADGQLEQALLDPAGVGDEHEQQAVRREVDDLEVAHGAARQRRVLHDGHLARQLREQAHRAAHDVVEVDGALEERLDRPALRGRQRLHGRQLVDEQPVALVGGDASGAGVGVGDVPLLLERRHVVADGGRAHAQAVPLGERLGAHRLGRGHEVLDDRPEDLELAVVQHAVSPPVGTPPI